MLHKKINHGTQESISIRGDSVFAEHLKAIPNSVFKEIYLKLFSRDLFQEFQSMGKGNPQRAQATKLISNLSAAIDKVSKKNFEAALALIENIQFPSYQYDVNAPGKSPIESYVNLLKGIIYARQGNELKSLEYLRKVIVTPVVPDSVLINAIRNFKITDNILGSPDLDLFHFEVVKKHVEYMLEHQGKTLGVSGNKPYAEISPVHQFHDLACRYGEFDQAYSLTANYALSKAALLFIVDHIQAAQSPTDLNSVFYHLALSSKLMRNHDAVLFFANATRENPDHVKSNEFHIGAQKLILEMYRLSDHHMQAYRYEKNEQTAEARWRATHLYTGNTSTTENDLKKAAQYLAEGLKNAGVEILKNDDLTQILLKFEDFKRSLKDIQLAYYLQPYYDLIRQIS